MKKDHLHLETKAVHSGEHRINGSVSMPIFQTAMFEYSGEASYHDVKYIRLNNLPNHIALSQKLAALENGEAAQVMGSGMAAITTTLLTVLKAGDHLLAQDCLYGGTYDFVNKDLADFGISFDFIDGNDPSSWASKLKPNTKAIYVESMSNPLLQVADLKAVVSFARANNLLSIIDNTFASPVNFRASEFGFDLTLHSCTKYLNGHSDIVAGAVIGSAQLVEKITHKLNHLGGSLDPHAAFLLHRGIKTVALRVKYQNESALKIAQFLSSHPKVIKVNYPGLETHPNYKNAKELFAGFGGMMSFELKDGVEASINFMKSVTIPVKAPSLGGVETLITLPARTSHAGMTPAEREKVGISDSLIRLSVGVEATEDLIEDFKQALEG
jgi:cystathionine beta-lyase/cystathionine gamma-synthase